MNFICQGRLHLPEVLSLLAEDGLVSVENARMLSTLADSVSQEHQQKHALVRVAERGWPDLQKPDQKLSLDRLLNWLASKLDLPIYSIDPMKVETHQITAVMSYAYAVRYGILAVEVDQDEVVIATAEPCEREWEVELGRVLRKSIRRVLVNPEALERYRLEFYALSKSVIGARSEHESEHSGSIQNFEQLKELGRAGKLDANDQHVVSIVDWLLQYAFEQRASDIHLEPRREHSTIRFRIDGVMHTVYEIPTPVMAAVTSRIKILGRMDVAEKRRPQDGRMKTRTAKQEIELRLSTMPTAFGEKLVMRIFDPFVAAKNAEGLGFEPFDQKRWEGMVHSAYGLILVTGPTGSGKTTTLYSTLRQLATPAVNVCTVEDPIEQVEPLFNQMQVQHAIGVNFASGIRTLLRQDPDLIMVGEIRDLETAEMAVQAALTGHLVLSTLHTNDAPSAITRLLEFGLPPYLINAALIGVMAQRLVRTLCPHCKRETTLDVKQWQQWINPWKMVAPERFYTPVGCLECRNTGYWGRTGIYELFMLTPALKQLVERGADVSLIRKQTLKEEMRPLRISGARKVLLGVTTMDEVSRVTPPAMIT